jgi:hypothetical protein
MFLYKKLIFINLSAFALLFITSPSLAKYDPKKIRGDYIQHFSTPYENVTETCVIPQHSSLAYYKDSDRKDEAMLCGIDFYGSTSMYDIPLIQVAICPKNRSTNPAVELYKLKSTELSIQAYESQQCRLPSKKRDKKLAKRLAKFKQSISCSYTPSILGYYHVSRMLGNIGDVSPAVIRTMALKRHRKIAKLGYQVARKYKQTIQAKTWKNMIDTENHIDSKSNKMGKKYSKKIFTIDNKQLFGAMQKDVKHEEKYKEFYIKNVKNSYRHLTSQPFVKKLLRQNINAKTSVAMLYQLKDYSDMLVIDYILSQEDRFGNMAYKDYYYFINDAGEIQRSRIRDSESELSTEQSDPNLYKVRRLVLKDNDCGVNRLNRTKQSKIMSKIRHMSLNTYQSLLKLEANIETENLEHFFKNELLFSTKDWENFEHAIQNLKSILQKNCRSGRLSLDLNPQRKILSLETIDSKSYCNLSI